MVTTRLRKLRDSKGYSQEFVAAKLGIGQNTYSKLESGQTRLTTDRVEKLADLYEIEPDYFFNNDDASVINNNHGENYKFVFNPETYIENQKELFEHIISEKDKQIDFLKEELQQTKAQLNQIISKLADKI